jgi:hypothetical protein
MVAKCSNPSCSAPFQYLKEGRLFRLESERALHSRFSRMEYFWLCPPCSREMTLRLAEDGTVVTFAFPKPIQGAPRDPPLNSIDRGMGLLLRRISPLWPQHLPHR